MMNERIKELAIKAGLSNDFIEDVRLWDVQQKFAELIIADYATKLVEANMRVPEYAAAMDAHYEQKWAHRFD